MRTAGASTRVATIPLMTTGRVAHVYFSTIVAQFFSGSLQSTPFLEASHDHPLKRGPVNHQGHWTTAGKPLVCINFYKDQFPRSMMGGGTPPPPPRKQQQQKATRSFAIYVSKYGGHTFPPTKNSRFSSPPKAASRSPSAPSLARHEASWSRSP